MHAAKNGCTEVVKELLDGGAPWNALSPSNLSAGVDEGKIKLIHRNTANYSRYLTFNVASYSKSELLEMRKRLSEELEQIRDFQHRIQSRQISGIGNPGSNAKIKKHFGNKKSIVDFDLASNRPINIGLDNRYLDDVNFEAMLKQCKQILGKLMKRKRWLLLLPAWVGVWSE
ncbi:hypothetical protein CASFOL_005227 [Castilleja foliolosa]|uniref:Uncharacterized protein n=1 Tax=Castilleja foliolosa TaxID=1961234 RepID=A0ABD3E3X7_9LAMI